MKSPRGKRVAILTTLLGLAVLAAAALASRDRLREEWYLHALKVGDKVEVIGMPPEDECLCEMFVTIRWNDEALGVSWPDIPPIVSERDQRAPTLEEWLRDPRSQNFRYGQDESLRART